MPVYNTQKEYLKAAIDSILHQDYPHFELLIVDDGSSEPHVQTVLKSYTDPRIILLRLSTNQGAGAARNLALQQAQGKFIAFLDSDDVAYPQRFSRQVDYLTKHPEIGCLGSMARRIPTNKIIGSWYVTDEEIRLQQLLKCCCPFIHSTVMLRRNILTEHHIQYTQEDIPAEDYSLWLKLFTCCKFAKLNEILVDYRWHGKNISILQAQKQKYTTNLLSGNKLLQLLDEAPNEQLAIELSTFFQKQEINPQYIPDIIRVLNKIPIMLPSYGIRQTKLIAFLRKIINHYAQPELIQSFPQLSFYQPFRHHLALYIGPKLQTILTAKIAKIDKSNYTIALIRIGAVLTIYGLIWSLSSPSLFSLGFLLFNSVFTGGLLMKELVISFMPAFWKYYSYRFLNWCQPFLPKNTYILMDNLQEKTAECIDAYSLFLYLRQHHRRAYYLLWKANPLYIILKQQRRLSHVIAIDDPNNIFKKIYLQLFFAKNFLVSFHTPAEIKLHNFLRHNKYIRYIYINHGKTLLKPSVIPNYFTPQIYNYCLVSSAAERLMLEQFDWPADHLINIGLPRWDLLKRIPHPQKTILMMPTWRRSFSSWKINHETAKFYQSMYYLNILKLLTHPRLQELIITYNLRFIYAMHHSIITSGYNFPTLPVEIIDPNKISQYIGQSDLFITDYSSISFDFLFLNTPVIYYRHDFNDDNLCFEDKLDRKNVMEHDKELFNICYEPQEVIQYIKHYINNNFVLEPEKRRKAEQHFSTKTDIRQQLVGTINRLPYPLEDDPRDKC